MPTCATPRRGGGGSRGCSRAAAAGARAAAANPQTYFVDDEDSVPLFLGYSVAALDIQKQLAGRGIAVDAAHPLFVYLPCGVGGSPGGITFGLKLLFGDAVRCVFVEPVGAPCFLVQLAAGAGTPRPISELGLRVDTVADGLAVGAASLLVVRTVERLVQACVTCEDPDLYRWLARAWKQAGLRLEPSATAGFLGLEALLADTGRLGDLARVPSATHVIWTTAARTFPTPNSTRVWRAPMRSRTDDRTKPGHSENLETGNPVTVWRKAGF